MKNENKNIREFDIQWFKLLKDIAETTTRDINKNKKKNISKGVNNTSSKEKIEPYAHSIIGTKIEDLIYSDKHFFSNKYLSDHDNILKGFNEKTQHQKRKVQEKLLELYSSEGYWKNLTKKSQHELEPLKELFEDNSDTFVKSVKVFFEPSHEDLIPQRAYQRFAPWKIQKFLQGFFMFLVNEKDMKILEPFTKITANDAQYIIQSKINYQWLFFDITRIVVRKVYDNFYNPMSLNSKYKTFNENSFVVKRNTIYYEYRRVFALYLINATFDYFLENTDTSERYPLLKTNKSSLLEVIRNILWRQSHHYDKAANAWWLRDHSHLTLTLIHLYQESGIIREVAVERESNNRRESIKWVLPVSIEPAVMKYTELPRVYPPDRTTDESLDEALTPTLFGENFVTKNDKLKRILDIKQRKRFKVSKSYLKILKALRDHTSSSYLGKAWEKDQISLDLPFPNKREIAKYNKDILELEDHSGVSVLSKIAFDELHTGVVGRGASNFYLDSLRKFSNFTSFDLSVNQTLQSSKNERAILDQQLKNANSCIRIAESYINVPIYITNTMCVRIRLYPRQSIISRTSGQFKQLLCDYKDTKLTLSGFIELFRCYYRSESIESLIKFNEYLSNIEFSKKKGEKLLYEYFYKNPIEISKVGRFLYTSQLHVELLKAEITGKTAVNVEIDQVASVLMFMALFFRSRKLAEISNLLGGPVQCPYSFIMDYMKKHYVSNVEYSEKGDHLIKLDRKTTKMVTMCFGYSQTETGRNEFLIERAYEVFPDEKDLIMENYLKDYSSQFKHHFNTMFPNIVDQIEILKKVVNIVVKETDRMTIDNITGIRMSWARFAKETKKAKAFHPVTKEALDLSIKTIKHRGKKPVNDMVAHYRQILSYIIHSMDSSVIQYFILEMFDQFSTIINTLHDCGLLHPNHVDNFYKVVEQLYKSGSLYNSADTCFFKAVKSVVSADTVPKIEALEKEFYAFCDDFECELNKFNARAAYQGEH